MDGRLLSVLRSKDSRLGAATSGWREADQEKTRGKKVSVCRPGDCELAQGRKEVLWLQLRLARGEKCTARGRAGDSTAFNQCC